MTQKGTDTAGQITARRQTAPILCIMVELVGVEVLFSSSLAPRYEQIFSQRFCSDEFASSIRTISRHYETTAFEKLALLLPSQPSDLSYRRNGSQVLVDAEHGLPILSAPPQWLRRKAVSRERRGKAQRKLKFWRNNMDSHDKALDPMDKNRG